MTEITYSYSRLVRDFQRIPEFQANETEMLTEVAPNAATREHYTKMNPREIQIQNAPTLSEASTNTERVKLRSQPQTHLEAGWPNTVDPSEFEEKMKYCKKVEREEGYLSSCARLVDQCIEKSIKQNDAIDIYGEYFEHTPTPEQEEIGPASAKIVSVFKDPHKEKRTAAALSWQNDGRKLAVGYCRLKFQSHLPMMSPHSHIWDILNPNEPTETLVAPSPLCSIEYYTKDPHFIAGGSWNGVVQYWDCRQPSRAAAHSLVEASHKDPVWAVKWLQSKSGELLSVSTDGNVFVWDCRLPDRPTEIHSIAEDNLVLQPKQAGGGNATQGGSGGGLKDVLGGLCMDYDPQVGGPAKYMIGTEQGVILSCNRKGKTQQEKIGPNLFIGHHGPVYSVQRNPFFSKYFLSVGDWTARLWFEDFKFSPTFSTFYHKAYLTSGAWHTVRPGVFFTTRMDGYFDVWDLMFRQTTPSLSLHVSDYALHSVKPTHEGRMVATGGIDGNVTLIELSPSLSTLAPDEKNTIGMLFENESTRDKNLERSVKEKRTAARHRQSMRSSVAHKGQHRSFEEEVARMEGLSKSYLEEVNRSKEQEQQHQREVEEARRRLLKDIEDDVLAVHKGFSTRALR